MSANAHGSWQQNVQPTAIPAAVAVEADDDEEPLEADEGYDVRCSSTDDHFRGVAFILTDHLQD